MSLLTELDQVLAGAMGDRQFGAARAAIDSKARVKGLFVDKLEVGAPGDFSEPTLAETLQLVATEFNPATAAAIAWTMDHDDDEMPLDEIARFTLAVMPVHHTLARLEHLRTALLWAASENAQVVAAAPRDELCRSG